MGSTSKKPAPEGPVSLKELAGLLGLSPATISLVLNDSPAGRSIPASTRKKVLDAAERYRYRPNQLARSFRAKRTFLLGVLVPEISEGYSAQVLAGIETALIEAGFAYLVTSHRHKADLQRRYVNLLEDRRVEGLIAVDTPLEGAAAIPIVSVSGHREIPGVTNIVVDHDCAAELALAHLRDHSHRSIAFLRGQEFSSDTMVRWQAIESAAARLDIAIDPRLVADLVGDDPSPQTGFAAAGQLLSAQAPFSALFAFNDVSAIGAIHALREAGRHVPGDVSVVGFDDIHAAAFHNPALTTIRQPLADMGKLAAETLLERIASPDTPASRKLVVQPALIVRESTGPCRARQ